MGRVGQGRGGEGREGEGKGVEGRSTYLPPRFEGRETEGRGRGQGGKGERRGKGKEGGKGGERDLAPLEKNPGAATVTEYITNLVYNTIRTSTYRAVLIMFGVINRS